MAVKRSRFGTATAMLPANPLLAATRRALLFASSAFLLPPASSPAAEPPSICVACYAATTRTIAIGDLHGDADAFVDTLRLARLIDEGQNWSGGDTTLVQIGDVLDRGSQERECFDLLRTLKKQAKAAGGRVVTLLGNHEVLNAAGITIYATETGQTAFGENRAAAFAPGGMLASELATWPVACLVGDTLFVHGGVTPSLARDGLASANDIAARWLRGDGALPPPLLLPTAGGSGGASPLWTRDIGVAEPAPTACRALSSALADLGASRVVVGHTVQEHGISCACEKRVWRIDVGLSRGMLRAPPQALEIDRAGRVRTLGATPASAARSAGLAS